jgi:hypothetical protein
MGAASAMAKFRLPGRPIAGVVCGTKVVVVETRGCRRANKVGDGASDDVFHDLGVGSKVGRVRRMSWGWFSQLVQRRGDGRTRRRDLSPYEKCIDAM